MDRMKSEFSSTPAADSSHPTFSNSTSVPTDDNDIPLRAAVVHLPTSGSIQVKRDNSGGNEEEPAYQFLEEKDESTVLDDFLASLGITQQHLSSVGISRTTLLQLYR